MSTVLSSKFATYQSMELCLDFHHRGNEIFVEKKAAGEVIQYSLDLSISSLEKVPAHVRLSAEKTVQWLIHHYYAPSIDGGKIVFRLQGPFNVSDFTLHEAASKGDLIAVKLWIEANKPLDILNGFQKTPLYIATIHGHQEIIDCLLNAGATPVFPGNLQETILHVTAFYGHEALLKQLLIHPKIRKYLNSQDREGRQPLHKAFLKKPQPHIIELLLESGSAINQKDHQGNTPLHGAVKSGCLKSVELLVQKGALILEQNHQHETPLDIALTPPRYEIAYYLLKIAQPLPPPPGYDKLAYYANLLLEGKKIDSIKEQMIALIQISDHYIEQNLSQEKNSLAQYQGILNAAKFLNAALAILEKAPERMKEFEEAIFKKISKIEHNFIKGQGFNAPDESELLHSYRVYLKAYRQACDITQADPFAASRVFSEYLAEFLRHFIQKGISIFGAPPVKWAAISMGSMARREMCPYSDVDFGFLIESSTPAALVYFRRLSQFLQLRITNMGETPFPVFGGQEQSPTPQGLRFDGIGESELIGTPLYFAGFQTARRMEENIIFTNVLNCTDYLDGDLKLVQIYEQERKRICSQKTGTPAIPFYKLLGLHLLEGHLLEFKPNLSLEKEELKAFGIKKELYRPLQEVINGLALFFDIKEKNSLERIDALAKLKVFSERGATNIKRAFKDVLSLRLKAHLFYKSEEEILFHKELDQIEDPHKLYIDPLIQSQLKKIYGLLLPFFCCIQEFIKSPNPKNIYNNDFANGLYSPHAAELSRNAEYKKAEEAFQQALALNPNDLSSLLEMSSAEEELGDPVNALKRAQHAIKVAMKMPDSLQKEYHIGQAYQQMGNAFHRMGNYQEALEAGKQFLSILLALGDRCDKVQLSYAYDLIGRALQMLEQYEEALGYFHTALEYFEEKLMSLKEGKGRGELYILNHKKDAAAIYNNIGLVLRKMNSLDEAFKYYQIALEMKLSFFGEKHPEVATSYGNIGVLLFKQKKYSEALKYHFECHRILTAIFGDNHPDIGLCCDEIGLCLQEQGRLKEAIVFYKQALIMLSAAYHPSHPDITLARYHIMVASSELEVLNLLEMVVAEEKVENYTPALKKIEEALEIIEDLPKGIRKECQLARCYQYKGTALYQIGDYEEALKSSTQLLSTLIALGDECDEDSLSCAHELRGRILQSLKQNEEALEHYIKTIQHFEKNILSLKDNKSEQEAYILEHQQDMASIYNNMGVAFCDINSFDESFKYHQFSLEIKISLFGKKHPEVAVSYANIGLLFFTQEKYEDALKSYFESYHLLISIFGEKHPDIGVKCDEIGLCLQKLGKLKEAIVFYKKAVSTLSAAYDDSHMDVRLTKYHLAEASQELEALEKNSS